MATSSTPLRRALGVAVLVAAFALPLVATIDVRLSGPEPDELALGVVGPTVVSQAVSGRVEQLPGRPFDAVVVDEGTTVEEVEREVASGVLDAAVVMDLGGDTDRLVVPTTMSDDLVAEVRAALGAVGASYGRSIEVTDVPPPRSAGAWRGLPYAFVVAWVLIGVGAATGLSAWRGPVAATSARGAGRLALLAGLAVVVGGLSALLGQVAADANPAQVVRAAAATVLVSSWLTQAFETLFGLPGIAVATAGLVGPLAPLLAGVDPGTMPGLWPDLYQVGPHDAALTLATRAVFGVEASVMRPALLLAAWATVAVVTLVTARSLRPARETEAAGPA